MERFSLIDFQNWLKMSLNCVRKFLPKNPVLALMIPKIPVGKCQFFGISFSSAWRKRFDIQNKCSRSWRIANKRSYSTFSSKPQQQLLVRSYGEPSEVVCKEEFFLPRDLGKRQVTAKLLASPVNPADINTIQGMYAVKPDFPFVPGNEAVMEVIETSNDVTSLKIGDRVIPKLNAMGTWRSAIVAEEDSFIKIPADMDEITASTIAVNPCTAYRMLTDFVELKPGDVVIQNCANSAVGQAVIQIAALKGIHTVNIVRQRPTFEEVKNYLTSLGSTLVVADSELRANKLIEELPKPLLALNGVSGKSGTDLLRQLANGGTMVTYGGMSRQPLTVGVGSLIFNDLRLRGFWMTAWTRLHLDDPERLSMLEFLFDLSRKGKLHSPPHDLVPFENYKIALQQAMPPEGMVGRKQILVFQ